MSLTQDETGLPLGRYLFENVGAGKKNLEVNLDESSRVTVIVSPYLMSRYIDWAYDSEKNEGKIFAGWNLVGTFKRIGDPK